jgi:hypothetical protein
MMRGELERTQDRRSPTASDAVAHLAIAASGLLTGAILAFIAAISFGLIAFRC